MNRKKDRKIALTILGVFALIVLLYVGIDFYFDYTGPVQTLPLYPVEEHQNITVQGFAVRDEAHMENGNNISILKKQSGKVYIPIVDDSASVAVGDSIAVSFDTAQQAELYSRVQLYEKKIVDFEQTQSLEHPSVVNAVNLNTDISSSLNAFLAQAESGNYAELDTAQRNLNLKIITKHIASGGNINVAEDIRKYAEKKAQLERKIRSKSFVTSPYAGYFVSDVDGYETACDYNALSKGNITTELVDSLFQMEPNKPENSMGKIIGQHVWFFVCNLSAEDAASMKPGHQVVVDFPKENLYSIPMKVRAVSEQTEGQVAVVFQCTQMNDAISKLRTETAEITVNTYNGFRVSNHLLVENTEQLTGVYVLAGKRVVFKPVKKLYEANGYTIVGPALYYLENGELDTKKTPDKPVLENYDQLIVKGKNLYDGKVIS